MGILDKVVATLTPEADDDERTKARAEARALAGGDTWLAMVLDHHELIEGCFAAVKGAETAEAQRAAQAQLAELLTAHSLAEEVVLYPAMALDDQKGHATTAYAQQSAAKVQIAALDDLEPLSQDYLDKLEHLRAAVAHHVYEEESTWFPALAREADDAKGAQLTARYDEEFDRYMSGGEVAAMPEGADVARRAAGIATSRYGASAASTSR